MIRIEIESKLHNMIGKLYTYKLKEHRLLRFTCNDNNFKVVTNKEDLIINNSDAKSFFNDFLFIDEEKPFVPKTALSLTGPTAINQDVVKFSETSIQKNSAALADIIMENIKLVKEDKNYISQATAINEQLKSLIEIGKTEVEIMKAQVGFMRFSKGGDLF
jgi:ATP-dependent Lon protease